jgi:cold shock CspA family protein
MYRGKLTSCINNKEFGFIKSDALKQDTFIHISVLTVMSKKPKTGDFIYFEVEKEANGKIKAINCRINISST